MGLTYQPVNRSTSLAPGLNVDSSLSCCATDSVPGRLTLAVSSGTALLRFRPLDCLGWPLLPMGRYIHVTLAVERLEKYYLKLLPEDRPPVPSKRSLRRLPRAGSAVDRHRLQRFDAAHGGLAANGTEERVDTGESLQSRLPTFDLELRRWRARKETPEQRQLSAPDDGWRTARSSGCGRSHLAGRGGESAAETPRRRGSSPAASERRGSQATARRRSERSCFE
jgi:hypothetical protein